MEKPREGDILLIAEHAQLASLLPRRVKVIAVFDDYEPFEPGGPNDWGDFGEQSWAQRDVDADYGRKGDWYAIVHGVDEEHETCSVASYEVEANVGQ